MERHKKIKGTKNMTENNEGYKVADILSEFKVTSENGLLEKLALEALTLDCMCCSDKIELDKVVWGDGDPFCSKYCEGLFGGTWL